MHVCGDMHAGKALREAATKGMDGILSQEPTAARHALALAVHLAQHNAPQLLDAQKDLTTVVAATCSMYEASGAHCRQPLLHPQSPLHTAACARVSVVHC